MYLFSCLFVSLSPPPNSPSQVPTYRYSLPPSSPCGVETEEEMEREKKKLWVQGWFEALGALIHQCFFFLCKKLLQSHALSRREPSKSFRIGEYEAYLATSLKSFPSPIYIARRGRTQREFGSPFLIPRTSHFSCGAAGRDLGPERNAGGGAQRAQPWTASGATPSRASSQQPWRSRHHRGATLS